jgi:hypothetical protein
MRGTTFDQMARLFAARRVSRHRALAQGGAGLAAAGVAAALIPNAAAQDATPIPAFDPAKKRTYLFVQSFQRGRVAAKAGAADTYTLTLEQGLGQTLYFSDRPDRDVGAAPTPQFLDGLGFPPDNPPNAALVVETAPGDTDVAVLELFAPAYDEATHTATYEVKVLRDWQRELEMGFTEAPTDLARLLPQFGAAHLFVDDCADAPVVCTSTSTGREIGRFSAQEVGGYCYNFPSCHPCVPYYHDASPADAWDWWTEHCSQTFHCDCYADDH